MSNATKIGVVYLLYDGSSPDGRGEPSFKRATKSVSEAIKHFMKVTTDPYSQGKVQILREHTLDTVFTVSQLHHTVVDKI